MREPTGVKGSESLLVRDLMTSPVFSLHPTQSLPLAESMMQLARIRHVPVVDDAGHVVGLVAHRDLLSASISALAPLTPDERSSLQLAVPVSRIMKTEVWTIGPDAPAVSAARTMRDHGFGCLPVVEHRKLVGIITESDLLRLVTESLDLSTPTRPWTVEDAMTGFPAAIDRTTTIAQARSMMSRFGIRHLPIVDGSRPIGILSDRDLRVAEAVFAQPNDAVAERAVRLVGHDKIYEVAPRELLHAVLLEMVGRSLDAAMVVVNDRLVGILTTTDACKVLAEHLRASYARA